MFFQGRTAASFWRFQAGKLKPDLKHLEKSLRQRDRSGFRIRRSEYEFQCGKCQDLQASPESWPRDVKTGTGHWLSSTWAETTLVMRVSEAQKLRRSKADRQRDFALALQCRGWRISGHFGCGSAAETSSLSFSAREHVVEFHVLWPDFDRRSNWFLSLPVRFCGF